MQLCIGDFVKIAAYQCVAFYGLAKHLPVALQKRALPFCRDCKKSATQSTFPANAATIPGKKGVSLAASAVKPALQGILAAIAAM